MSEGRDVLLKSITSILNCNVFVAVTMATGMYSNSWYYQMLKLRLAKTDYAFEINI